MGTRTPLLCFVLLLRGPIKENYAKNQGGNLLLFFAMYSVTVSSNDPRFMSIRMNSSRHSSLFAAVIITSIGDFKPEESYTLWMGPIASDRDCPTITCPRRRSLAAMVRKVMAEAKTRYEEAGSLPQPLV